MMRKDRKKTSASGASIAFTAAYVLIEGCYLVRDSSPITQNEQVDKAGVTVTVGLGSAYALYLSRELKHANIVRAPSSPAVVETFVAQNIDVAAGVKQQLEIDAARDKRAQFLLVAFQRLHCRPCAFAAKRHHQNRRHFEIRRHAHRSDGHRVAIEGFVAHLAASENVGDRMTDQLADALEPVARGARLGEGTGHCALL